MVAFPPCKINLGIRVLRRRPDGFHDIETCFYPVPRTDILEVVPGDDFLFEPSNLLIPGPTGENLCVKAYELLKRDHDLPPVHIYLHKLIPFGAGLGGGSSDGAWTLRLLNEVCELKLSLSELRGYASMLGSDCAFFLENGPKIGTGKGEQLSEVKVSLKGSYLIMVKPDVHVSTKTAYENIIPSEAGRSVKDIVEQVDKKEWRNVLANQFESGVMKAVPVIASIKEDLYKYGAFYASMSGSGSAVFGLFNEETQLRERFGGHDYWSGWLTD